MTKKEEELQSEIDTLRNALEYTQERYAELEIRLGIMTDRYVSEMNNCNELKYQLIRSTRQNEGTQNDSNQT